MINPQYCRACPNICRRNCSRARNRVTSKPVRHFLFGDAALLGASMTASSMTGMVAEVFISRT